MSCHAVSTHLAAHSHTIEHLCGVRAGADRTRLALTVILTVGNLTYTAKTVALYNALEAVSLAGADDVDERSVGEHLYREGVAQIQLLFKSGELGQVTLGLYAGLLEVSQQGSVSMLLGCFLEAELNGLVAILLNTLQLSNDAGTQFNNSAWYVLNLGTEKGSKSDCVSNYYWQVSRFLRTIVKTGH